jgi:hypothetical protein
MAILTIFTAPKPFSDAHIATIQRNAIRCWRELDSQVEVLLIGDEPGMAQAAAELQVRQLPQVARNQQGTPLVNSIFAQARAHSTAPLLAYLNADILVFPDFIATARKVAALSQKFLLVGQRWDLEVTQDLDFGPVWERRLRDDLQRRGRQHAPAGSDYFIFPCDLFIEMPDFAIGRAGWDNWMIYHARQQGWPVIDATPSLQVIHQNHDYSHLPGGKPHYDLEESEHNMALAGGQMHMYNVLDTDRQLRDGRIQAPRPSLLRMLRLAEMKLAPADGSRRGPRWALARRFRRWRRALTDSRS